MFWRKNKKNKINELMSRNLPKEIKVKIEKNNYKISNHEAQAVKTELLTDSNANKLEVNKPNKNKNQTVTIVIVFLIIFGIGISLLHEKREIPICNYQNSYRIFFNECIGNYEKQFYSSIEECAKDSAKNDILLKMKMKICK
jgi:hypothetical protein